MYCLWVRDTFLSCNDADREMGDGMNDGRDSMHTWVATTFCSEITTSSQLSEVRFRIWAREERSASVRAWLGVVAVGRH